jgi:ribosome hibernation promoting factor
VKITVKARNLELDERLRDRIERKLRRLDRISHPDAEATVELIANASHANDEAHLVEVTLVNNGSVTRSAATGPTLIAAVDRLLDKLERQVVRTKQKPRSARGRTAEETAQVLAREATGSLARDEELLPPTVGPSVVKIKRFDMVPMFEEDAIDRMEELGHAFFVFLNAESEEICVVYRRSDGAYGLIEPVLQAGRRGRRRSN